MVTLVTMVALVTMEASIDQVQEHAAMLAHLSMPKSNTYVCSSDTEISCNKCKAVHSQCDSLSHTVNMRQCH